MRLITDSGLWVAGEETEAPPLAAVVEVSGAVLSWTIDGPPDATRITLTDPSRADWMWRVLGADGHVALASAVDSAARSIELTGVDIAPGSVAPLRRLALGHWLQRWWPASRRDGVPALDRALLDVEVALLTVGAQGFFTDDTLDSDVAELLRPHATALIVHVRDDDARIRDLVRAGVELGDELGIDGSGWAELAAAVDDSGVVVDLPTGRRDDYALAAGADDGADRGAQGAAPIARGVASIKWSGVPARIFDAAEDTVDWYVEATGTAVVAAVRAAVIGPDPATGVTVLVRSGALSATGALDADGHATLPLFDAQQRPLTESAAWDHDWAGTSVIVGAEASESREARERVRRWARARLNQPSDDTYLAEILAGESSY
ncbi:hypothetical protein [Mycobacterium conspicuum]|jgi:hypothetical protein|uniref:Uncharacterized protein n=1 Tax=Mycobacterium conspicuum TaxID=44010 RepID=A0A1X1SWD0_9MYCO|nr:hypothetical protein [Mycobacterium conspicuum]ORV35195.1 hypothetical protein AWC00_01310 [Mycobacterium conspicuum]BBZ42042.1 hypothetical protein MCNS_51050 [Mycobacterium conspicuum]